MFNVRKAIILYPANKPMSNKSKKVRGREVPAQNVIGQVTSIRLQQSRLGKRKWHDLLRQQAETAPYVGRDSLFQNQRCSGTEPDALPKKYLYIMKLRFHIPLMRPQRSKWPCLGRVI
ncbi:hypothetical protein BN439_1673 [Erwinia amylovora Ea644]|uniref:hypothetical protein n=1 Tax=Erwinia amylovora TaxID=552 RepID=UPI0002CC38F1|nr:hypothetical protein [Erwinia amylovora]CCP02741.1 hypothetical protein BN439_1673 [Erwinia amylovora Ea644]CCP06768.1 hypothetical protein BN440_1736 [Erwinia amylovora MR1]